jgi:hypothetical protein
MSGAGSKRRRGESSEDAGSSSSSSSAGAGAARPLPDDVKAHILKYGKPLRAFTPSLIGWIEFRARKVASGGGFDHYWYRQHLVVRYTKLQHSVDPWVVEMHEMRWKHLAGTDVKTSETHNCRSFPTREDACCLFAALHKLPLSSGLHKDAGLRWSAMCTFGVALSDEEREEFVMLLDTPIAKDDDLGIFSKAPSFAFDALKEGDSIYVKNDSRSPGDYVVDSPTWISYSNKVRNVDNRMELFAEDPHGMGSAGGIFGGLLPY